MAPGGRVGQKKHSSARSRAEPLRSALPASSGGGAACIAGTQRQEGKGTGQPTASSVLKLGKCPATSSEHGTGGPASPLIRQDHRPRRTLSSCEPHHRSTTPSQWSARAAGRRGTPGLLLPDISSRSPIAIGVICPATCGRPGPRPRPRRGGQFTPPRPSVCSCCYVYLLRRRAPCNNHRADQRPQP